MPPLHYDSIFTVSTAIATGELSPVALTEAMLSRIGALDPHLHAYATVLPESAMAQARTAETAIRNGHYLGPLHGIPIAVKDNIWTKDCPTTNGMAIRADYKPPVDSSIIDRLNAAGAILLGKAQQTEGAFVAHHPSVTEPVNPWHPDAWCGVSSSGSAVAAAAGLCFAALGTDTGGSIRVPCDMNGLTGIKPTYGRVTRHGVFENGASLDHVGVLARSCWDVAAVLGIIAGSDPRDPTSAPLPVPDYLGEIPNGIEGIRIGIDPLFSHEGVATAVQEAFEVALRELEKAGATIVEVRYPAGDDLVRDWMLISAAEMAAAHQEHFPSRQNEYGPVLANCIELGRSCTATDYHKASLRRAEFSGRLLRLFGEIDLFAVPTQTIAGPTRSDIAALFADPNGIEKLARFTCPFDMSGSPSLMLPAGFTATGLPMTFQLIGRHFDEALMLRAGYAYQNRTDWHTRHPDL